MFEVGFSEIVLILGLALLVLGPEKLPGLAEKVGRWTGRARAMARQLRTQLEQEVTLDQMSKSRPMQAPPAYTPETASAPASTHEASTYEAPTQEVSTPEVSPAEPAAEAAPAAGHEHAAEPLSAGRPHHANPGLDLETMVSGMEPPPQAPVETAAAPKAAP